jgi:ubiquinone/menaquinone biosynthesis C-methylase UbiE
VGRQCARDIEAVLERIGRPLGSFSDILDFGVGCGRTITWLMNVATTATFYGTDTDSEAVSWCRENLGSAIFSTNGLRAPLEYPPETFDLIYAVSVFTHLDEKKQFLWLEELKRIVKSDGVLIVTLHGPESWEEFSTDRIKKLEEKGLLFIEADGWRSLFPEWYGTTYHNREYVEKHYSKYFSILDYVPRGLNNHQDLIVLCRGE